VRPSIALSKLTNNELLLGLQKKISQIKLNLSSITESFKRNAIFDYFNSHCEEFEVKSGKKIN
jgi:hypothetical protein